MRSRARESEAMVELVKGGKYAWFVLTILGAIYVQNQWSRYSLNYMYAVSADDDKESIRAATDLNAADYGILTGYGFAGTFCVAGLADYARCPAVNDEDGPQRVGALVHDENFGTVDLDWEERTVRLSLRRAQHRPGVYTPRAGPYDAGAELQHVTIRMDELTCIPH